MRIASSSVSNGMMLTTGPKISSWATREALSTSARTAGRMKKPGPSGTSPPVTCRAPSSTPDAR